LQADLTRSAPLDDLLTGCQVVVHCAALSSPWGLAQDFERVNRVATERLLEAAERTNIHRFVFVSTPSLYHGCGSRISVREDEPLPPPVNDYARTKGEAEARVQLAGSRGLETVILRPRAIFGPGDTTLIPRLLRALETGRLPIIGEGTNLADFTYVDNAADAVALACPYGVGQPRGIFNVTNDEPVALWHLLSELAQRLGYAAPRRRISRRAAMAIATASEFVARLRPGRPEPMLTRYGVQVLADTMTLDITRAKHLLGYRPRVSMAEGLDRLIASLEECP
jgi:nucleoside-diphosphate-sugar epimerase